MVRRSVVDKLAAEAIDELTLGTAAFGPTSTAAVLVDLVMLSLVGGVVGCGGGTISLVLGGVVATRSIAGGGFRAGVGGWSG
jgi:hypothetical protein